MLLALRLATPWGVASTLAVTQDAESVDAAATVDVGAGILVVQGDQTVSDAASIVALADLNVIDDGDALIATGGLTAGGFLDEAQEADSLGAAALSFIVGYLSEAAQSQIIAAGIRLSDPPHARVHQMRGRRAQVFTMAGQRGTHPKPVRSRSYGLWGWQP